MNAQQVDLFMTAKGAMFPEENQMQIREQLLALPEDKWPVIDSLALKNPTVTLILAILGPWDLFYLGKIGLGIVKWITCCGCYIWWIIGIFQAGKATRQQNLEKLMAAL